MATLGTNVMTLADIAKRMDPNLKDLAAIVEVLNNQNDILKFLPFMEGNLPTGHRVTLRKGKPTVGTRQINSGVTPGKSTTGQQDESTMLVEAYSEVDREAARISGNIAALRASEDVVTIEAMNDFFNTNLWYGNQTQYIDRFHGLAPRYSSLSGEYGNMIINAGGSSGSDQTSIWLLGLGERGLHGIFPKGTSAGLERLDRGEQLITDAAGTRRYVYQTQFVWHSGISIKDYRHLIRICNIDTGNLSTFGSGSDTSAKLLRTMVQALNKIPGNPNGYGLKYVFCMNKTVKTWADIMTMEKANAAFQLKEIYGQEFTTFRGVPIVTCDAITDGKSVVS